MKHILNNILQEDKQRILEQHSGGMVINTSSFKRLLESKLGDIKLLVMEGPSGDTPTVTTNTTPGDPSQSTVDLSTDYVTLKTALATYNSTFQDIMGVDPGLFLKASSDAPSQILLTSNTRQSQSGQGSSGNNFVLKYDIPTSVLTRRIATNPVKFNTLTLDGNSIGAGGGGIWSYGLTADLMKKDKKVKQVKAAANVVGAALATFFIKVQTSVPKKYVITKDSTYGHSELVFNPPTI
jgi:hypothetical protein